LPQPRTRSAWPACTTINRPEQDVIGDVGQSSAGNTIIRTGVVTQGRPGWARSGHIVLTPDERERLVADLAGQRPDQETPADAPGRSNC